MISAEGFDIAEIEIVGLRNVRNRPGRSLVERFEVSAVRPAGPGDAVRERADAAKILFGPAVEHSQLLAEGGGGKRDEGKDGLEVARVCPSAILGGQEGHGEW